MLGERHLERIQREGRMAENWTLMADNWVLWEDARFAVTTTANPHLPPEEGCHLLVLPRQAPPHAWACLTGSISSRA